MAIAKEQVVRALMPDEPDYSKAATLGPEALPFLDDLVAHGEPGLAAKAVSLAGRIQDKRAVQVLEKAMKRPEPHIRVAAAAAALVLKVPDAETILFHLLDDGDVGVRRVAVEAIPAKASSRLNTKLETLLSSEPHEGLRKIMHDIYQQLKKRP